MLVILHCIMCMLSGSWLSLDSSAEIWSGQWNSLNAKEIFERKVSVCYKKKISVLLSSWDSSKLSNLMFISASKIQRWSGSVSCSILINRFQKHECYKWCIIINAYIPVSLVVYNWFPREYSLLWAPPAACTTISLSSESDVVVNFPDNVNVWQLICLTFVPIKSLSITKKKRKEQGDICGFVLCQSSQELVSCKLKSYKHEVYSDFVPVATSRQFKYNI